MSRGTAMSGHQSARMKSAVYLTPPVLLRPLGRFDLDPCAAPQPRPWPTAAKHIGLPDDGLAARWAGRVWCNPPFGGEAATWVGRMAEHGNGIALVPARTETRYWYEYIWPRATGILFVRGRPHFHDRAGRRLPFNSGAPIALIAYGAANGKCLRDSGLSLVPCGQGWCAGETYGMNFEWTFGMGVWGVFPRMNYYHRSIEAAEAALLTAMATPALAGG